MRQIDRSLLEIFSSEQGEHVMRIRALLDVLASSDAAFDPAALEELQRRAHTLKGAAHAVGLEPTQIVVHRLESVFSKIAQDNANLTPQARNLIEHALETVEDVLAAVLAENQPPDVRALQESLEAFPQSLPAQPRSAAAPVPAGAASANPAPESDLVRVSVNRIDDLVRSSSELLVAAVLDAKTDNPFRAQAQHIQELWKEWSKLRRTPAAGTVRGASAILNQANASLRFIDRELDSLRHRIHSAADAWDTRARDVGRLAEELYENACNIRTTPAETVFAGFGPLVRELAHQENKRVEFRAEGLETQADRIVLQTLKDPVLHLLRNAVSHGAESESERAAAGKAPVNTIRMRIQSRGDRLHVTVEDDGKGIDAKKVIAEAAKRGLIQNPQEFPPSNIAKLVLMPGLSTAKEITNLSGRGLGLSIVQDAVQRLQGDISVRPAPTGGTVVSISVPLAVSTQHVVLVEVAGHRFAIATAFIESLLQIRPADIQQVDGRDSIIADSDPVPLVMLGELLKLPAQNRSANEDTAKKFNVVIVSANDTRLALVVDALVDERNAVVNDTGLDAARAGLSVGAIPLEDGSVAVVLNVPELFARSEGGTRGMNLLAPEQKKKTASILVADDSLTTRSLEKSILEAHGFRVRVAVDGMQALELIRAEVPDLVISDVMMPRMTGFELLAAIKADSELKKIPVILVTSLENREEQARGLELGADAYIVKRKFDQTELMRIVRQIV